MLSPHRTAARVALGVVAGIVGFSTLGVWALPFFYAGRILPGVAVHGIAVGGLTPEDAAAALRPLATGAEPRVRFAHAERVVREPAPSELGTTLDVARTVGAARAVGRAGGLRVLADRFALLVRGKEAPSVWQAEPAAVAAYLQQAFAHLLRPPTEPTWGLSADGAFEFHPGGAGTDLPWAEVAAAVADRLARNADEPVPLRFVSVPPAMSGAEARVAGVAVARVTAQPLALTTEERAVVVPTSELERWARVSSSLAAGAGAARAEPELDRSAIERTLRTLVAPQVTQAPQDAQFEVSGDRATVFAPSRPGVALVVPDSATGILQGLAAGADRVKLVTRPVPPAVTVTPLMAEYGIRTLLASGESDFAGSPKNRRHNIRVGSEKYHGLLVAPGAEFSFNTNLGPVDGEHGFLRELVILSNVTTPQFGGGLCQVSTTMFRSAIHAGLPITARKNHAYAVSYYGTPGFDATIYPPNPDLRFVNDTPGHFLIQMKLEGAKLAFEFWGTSDGRQVEVLGPAPFDRKPDGAVKATLVRKVTRGGETKRDEWYSAYKSPKLFPKVLAANAETETWEQRVARIAEKDRRAQEEFGRKKAELLKKQQGTGNRGQRAAPSTTRMAPTPQPTPKLSPAPEPPTE